MADNNNSLHIVVFPWLAFGHLLPFLSLSKTLASRSHRISFVSTPRNIQRLPKIPHKLASFITFVQLPLPQVSNLPSNAEATMDVSYDQVQYLKLAFDALASPLSLFLQQSSNSSSPPDLIISDFGPYWLPQIASELNIPFAYFNIFNASTSVFFSPPSSWKEEDTRKKPEDFVVPPKWIPFDSNLAFRLHEIIKIFDAVEGNASGVTDWHRFLSVFQGCDVVAVRSCYELEGEFLNLSQEIFDKNVIPIGLLPPEMVTNKDDREDEMNCSNWVQIRSWLDRHEPSSVVYVAFGTEVKLNQREINELALGLESSNLPFFWVLRNNSVSSPSPDQTEETQILTLPDGFEERVKNRGLVFTEWAPQRKILAHRSIGGFMNQSGWSSVIEGLANGLPMVVLPMVSTQGLVARIVERKKIGAEVRRDETTGDFTSEDVAAALRLVMVDEEGKETRDSAKRMKEIVNDVRQHQRLVDHFERWIRMRWKKKKKKSSFEEEEEEEKNCRIADKDENFSKDFEEYLL